MFLGEWCFHILSQCFIGCTRHFIMELARCKRSSVYIPSPVTWFIIISFHCVASCFFFKVYVFLYVWVLLVCMQVYCMGVYQWNPEEGTGFPGTGVMDYYKSPCGCWELDLSSFLTNEPSLQAVLLFLNVFWCTDSFSVLVKPNWFDSNS